MLDEFCFAILKRSEIFERLEKSGKHITEKGQALLQMIKAGYFTEGETLKAVRARVQNYVNNPVFIKALAKSEVDGGQKSRALMEFKELLRTAGMAEMV